MPLDELSDLRVVHLIVISEGSDQGNVGTEELELGHFAHWQSGTLLSNWTYIVGTPWVICIPQTKLGAFRDRHWNKQSIVGHVEDVDASVGISISDVAGQKRYHNNLDSKDIPVQHHAHSCLRRKCWVGVHASGEDFGIITCASPVASVGRRGF
jgi:hypothetical protein